MSQIKTVVFIVGGAGTRSLPFTLEDSKAFLPLPLWGFNVPLIHYLVEEAFAVENIEKVIIVSTEKYYKSFKHYFSLRHEVTQELVGKPTYLQLVQRLELISKKVSVIKEDHFWGHAYAAQLPVQNSQISRHAPYIVCLSDEVIYNPTGDNVFQQLIDGYNQLQASLMAMKWCDQMQARAYGVGFCDEYNPQSNLLKLNWVLEKPSLDYLPNSQYPVSIGYYVVTPEWLEAVRPLIKEQKTHRKDGILMGTVYDNLLNDQQDVYGCMIEGDRYDTGNAKGYWDLVVSLYASQREYFV
jgi:UTP--glucose-1-phosphate uridylyltransferase